MNNSRLQMLRLYGDYTPFHSNKRLEHNKKYCFTHSDILKQIKHYKAEKHTTEIFEWLHSDYREFWKTGFADLAKAQKYATRVSKLFDLEIKDKPKMYSSSTWGKYNIEPCIQIVEANYPLAYSNIGCSAWDTKYQVIIHIEAWEQLTPRWLMDMEFHKTDLSA